MIAAEIAHGQRLRAPVTVKPSIRACISAERRPGRGAGAGPQRNLHGLATVGDPFRFGRCGNQRVRQTPGRASPRPPGSPSSRRSHKRPRRRKVLDPPQRAHDRHGGKGRRTPRRLRPMSWSATSCASAQITLARSAEVRLRYHRRHRIDVQRDHLEARSQRRPRSPSRCRSRCRSPGALRPVQNDWRGNRRPRAGKLVQDRLW